MSTSLTIAKLYSEALFETVSDEEHEVARWIYFFSLVEKVLSDRYIYNLLILNPCLEIHQKVNILLSLINLSKLPRYAYNVVRLLIEKKRISLLSEIFEQFQILKDKKEGLFQILIISPFSLTEMEINNIIPLLEKRFQKRLKPKMILDQSLIGGICFKMGDQVLDFSILNQLTHMKLAIKKH